MKQMMLSRKSEMLNGISVKNLYKMHLRLFTVRYNMQKSIAKMLFTKSRRCVKPHSTALVTLLFFSDKRLSNKSIIINILGMIAMHRSIKLSFCLAFFHFCGKRTINEGFRTRFYDSRKSDPIFILEEFLS